MSIINIHCEEFYYGEFLSGVFLVQAGKLKDPNNPYIAPNGVPMLQGCFGLTISNDPFVVFSKRPVLDPYEENTEENDQKINSMSEKETEEYSKIYDTFNQYSKELTGHISDMGILYNACIKAGYDKNKGGLGYWLCNRIAEYIDKNPIILEKYPYI